MKPLSAERARQLLDYDPETGALRWKQSRSGISAGPAGCVGGPGYVYLTLDTGKYVGHRVIWLIVHGEWPEEDIDHINGVRTDNRLCNLRAVSRRVNNENRRRAKANNIVGLAGVSPYFRDPAKWRARIQVDGRQRGLGLYDSPELAHAAYIEAKRRLHAGCTI